MENEKIKEKEGKMPLWAKLICVLGLAFLGYKGYETWQLSIAKKDFVSPAPTVDAITKESFEDLPVGLIYEVPEDLQKQYKEAAIAKYETYKHLGAQQADSANGWNPEHFLTPREDVIARNNSKPSDMLNEDFSLRYPDMFYGFIIHDEKITGKGSEAWVNAYDNSEDVDFRNEEEMADKMNQIFYVEKEFNNGKKIHNHYGSTMENSYMGYVNGATGQDYPEAELFRRAVKSDFYKPDKEIGVVRTIYQYMFFANYGSQEDPYGAAYHDMDNNGSSYYFNEVKEIDLFPKKYNDVDNWEDTYGVYYYPTAVWKVDNNTIVVDIAVVNGDRMTNDDMYEILAKLNQANTHFGNNSSTQLYPSQPLNSDTYLVMGRFFDAESITNGIVPEHGTHILNYKSIDGWQNGLFVTHDRSTYVFNDKAKTFLKEFYNILEKELDTDNDLSTKKMIQQAAKKTGISYQDALNIYATHYSYGFLTDESSISWQ